MKIAVAIATADAMPSAFVVFRGIGESIEKAAKLGYDGVELALKSKEQIDLQEVKSQLAYYGLSVPTISSGQVFADSGLYFTSTDAAIRRSVIDVFKGLIETAAELGGAMVNIGRARGWILEGETREQTDERFAATIRPMLEEARQCGVTMILEPVNRYEINYINSVEDAARLIDYIGDPYFKIMPDVFHMNIEDRSIPAALAQYHEKIAYIHFADSNRLAPGQGHLPFSDIIATLRQVGYDGWISAEILPKPDPDTAAKQAIDYLRSFIPKEG